MVEEITKLEHPIDVMSLMHKAFEAVSERVERLAAEGQEGGDLAGFQEGFEFWIKQLLYHATTEDKYMTGPLIDSQPARDNETEHGELAQQGGDLLGFLEKGDDAALSESMKATVLVLEQGEHVALEEKLLEVQEALKKEIGQSRVVARNRRHLYQKVMALRVLEFDHFENEVAFVLPLVREVFEEKQELEMVRRLLIDDEAENPRWIIDWVASELTPGERDLLSDLEARFNRMVMA